jgi:hypothetical protein
MESVNLSLDTWRMDVKRHSVCVTVGPTFPLLFSLHFLLTFSRFSAIIARDEKR